MTMRPMLDICVCNPLTDKFTTFEIFVKTNDPAFTLRCSKTRRRYNDFVWLKKLLKSHHPLCAPPDLPEKKKSSERFEPQFLVRRMKELEKWLYKVIEESLYFSDTSFHLFLQTNLTCKQIEAYTSGSLAENILQEAYRRCDYNTENITFPSTFPAKVDSRPKPDDDDNTSSNASVGVPVMRDRNVVLPCNAQERADSGLSVTEPDSDMDSSSYESQSSMGNSEDSVLTCYPPVTEISSQLQKTSLKQSHMTCTTGSDVTLKADQSSTDSVSDSTESCDSNQTKSQELKDQVAHSPSHRVQMGVLFSVN